ncbi:hypothetical protein ACHAXT_011362 [Thalassiosira profunda]
MTADPVQALLDASPKRSCDLGNGEALTYRIFNAHNATNPNAIKLLFIPGYSTDATTLGGPEMALAFPDDHYVVAVNPRGYAGSTFHDPIDNHEGNADDLKLFLDKMNLTDVVAMGWSTGGGAAAWLAIKYPEVVRAAIMMNAIPLDGYRLPGVDTFDKVKDFVDAAFTPGIHSPDPAKFYDSIAPMVLGLASVDDATMQRFHEAAAAHVNRAHAQWANVTFNVTPVQTPTTAPSAALRDLKVPLIVLHGAEDLCCPTAQCRAVTQLGIAEKWAPDDLLSYYEHEGGHAPNMIPDETESFFRTYRTALEEQVLTNGKTEAKENSEAKADSSSPVTAQ